jgi:hypothetical protein
MMYRSKIADSESIQSQSSTRSSIAEMKEQKARSKLIDKRIADDKRAMRSEAKLLLLGHPESGKQVVWDQLRNAWHGGYSLHERKAYRSDVFDVVVTAMQTLLEELEEREIILEGELSKKHMQTVFQTALPVFEMKPELVTAVENL